MASQLRALIVVLVSPDGYSEFPEPPDILEATPEPGAINLQK